MCDIDFDGERADVWQEEPLVMSTETYKGRPHECSCCGQAIHRGDVYLKHKSHFAAESYGWCAQRLCFACWWSRETFAEVHRWSPMPGQFDEFLRECIMDNGDHDDPWRPHLAAIYRRRRMTRLGRELAARAREYRRRWRGRTSWALAAGGVPRRAA